MLTKQCSKKGLSQRPSEDEGGGAMKASCELSQNEIAGTECPYAQYVAQLCPGEVYIPAALGRAFWLCSKCRAAVETWRVRLKKPGHLASTEPRRNSEVKVLQAVGSGVPYSAV